MGWDRFRWNIRCGGESTLAMEPIAWGQLGGGLSVGGSCQPEAGLPPVGGTLTLGLLLRAGGWTRWPSKPPLALRVCIQANQLRASAQPLPPPADVRHY